MPCCLVALTGLLLPRVTLVLLWFLTNYMQRAYQTVLWPLLGVIFVPYTTLAYAVAQNEGGGLHDVWLALFILGVLMDAGALGVGHRARRRD